jgi:hypothetical protein
MGFLGGILAGTIIALLSDTKISNQLSLMMETAISLRIMNKYKKWSCDRAYIVITRPRLRHVPKACSSRWEWFSPSGSSPQAEETAHVQGDNT